MAPEGTVIQPAMLGEEVDDLFSICQRTLTIISDKKMEKAKSVSSLFKRMIVPNTD
jgi:hypothetical protein